MPETNTLPAPFLGEKLRAARERDKLSQRELAAKAEISASMLSQIETGKVSPSMRSMYNIATALSLPIDYFFPGTGFSAPVRVALEDMTASDLREAELNGDVDTNTSGFIMARPSTPVVYASARPTISLRGGVEWARLTAHADEGAEFLEITYAPGAISGTSLSHHIGREFGLVLEGELTVELGFERYVLKEGDSLIFDSSTPHRLSNTGAKTMRAMWVVLNAKQ
jgi:transcriptional regulator with XRE-family HTH domain/mannose-6-phosphate isomerase-like protein (cupin superfamily)